MTPQEYDKQLSELEANQKAELKRLETAHKDTKFNLGVEYAKANNDVKIGDTVGTNSTAIIVSSMKYHTMSLGGERPSMVYYGKPVKVNGKNTKKDLPDMQVYQCNMTELNGNSYKYQPK